MISDIWPYLRPVIGVDPSVCTVQVYHGPLSAGDRRLERRVTMKPILEYEFFVELLTLHLRIRDKDDYTT